MAGKQDGQLPIRILSHNIRYATSSPLKHERPWPERSPLIANELRFHTTSLTSIICLQEVLHAQLVDLLASLNKVSDADAADDPAQGPLWAHVGVARDDGKRHGEYNPILYPMQLFELLHTETIWLSPTPQRPSRGWDAACNRIMTVGVFEHREMKHRFVACNTHLDHAGSHSRENAVGVVTEAVHRLRREWRSKSPSDAELAVFLAGDFNSFPTQEAYLAMVATGLWGDLHTYVSPQTRYGDEITFTGFDPDEVKDERGRIDYIWLAPRNLSQSSSGSSGSLARGHLWKVEGYGVLPNIFDTGVYNSDHRCVVGDVSLNSG